MSAAPSGGRGTDVATLVIGIALAVLSAVIFFETRAMPVAGQYAKVGPTTAPYVIAGCLALLAIGHVVAAFRHGAVEREADRPGPMLWIVGGLVLQMLLLKPLGFSIATGMLFAFSARAFGRGPLWMTVPIGIAASLAIWLVFAGLLKLSLPAGPLEHLFR